MYAQITAESADVKYQPVSRVYQSRVVGSENRRKKTDFASNRAYKNMQVQSNCKRSVRASSVSVPEPKNTHASY